MAKLEWADDLLTGDHEIDNQHKTFYLKAQKIRVACNLHKGAEHLISSLGFLIAYTKEHFETEERRMKEIGYAHLQSHIEAHRVFSEKLKPLMQSVVAADDPEKVAHEVADLAVEWFFRHIRTVDMPFIEALTKFRAGTNP